MVDSVKNYGIAGVSTTLELGKQGAVIDASDSSVISLKDKDDALENIAIGEGTASSHAVTKGQLDEATVQKVSVKDINFSYNSGTVAIGTASANTTIQQVMVEKGTGNWTDANSTTEVTVGDASDVDRLFSGFEPAGGQFLNDADYKYSADTALVITVTQGGASAGTGQVRLYYTGTIE